MTSIIFVLLPLVAFFLLWIVFLAFQSSKKIGSECWQETLIKSGLFWSAYLVLGTELLSLFKGITSFGIILLWSFAIIVLGVINLRFHLFASGWEGIKSIFIGQKFGFIDKIFLIILFFILVIMLITGVMSPPNIHDVTIYHMSRVMHWMQNRSISFYATHMTWQLWQPPFSEFTQLHWYLLSRGDYLSSLSQWFSLVLIMVAVSGINKHFEVNRMGRWLSTIFILTLPTIVLQVSGAKNDIVLGFFCAALAYFVIKAAKESLNRVDWISIGLSVALGMLTKGSYVFFSFPLLLWLFIIIMRASGAKGTAIFILIGLMIVGLINGGHWARNFGTFNNPFGTGSADYLMNSRFGLDVVISNVLRNSAVQLSSIGVFNRMTEAFLEKVHNWMNMSLFDPAITLGPREFSSVPTREESAGNPLHFGLTLAVSILTMVGFIIKKKATYKNVLFLGLIALSGMVLFSAVFRWQAFGSRFLIPYFIFFAPVIGFVASDWIPDWLIVLASLIFILAAVYPLTNNYSRSFTWSKTNRNSIWHRSRRGLRFANHEIYEGAIVELSHKMDISGCRIYGLVIGGNSPEYLIWGTLKPDVFSYTIEHIAVNNQSEIHESKDFDPCGIIVFEGRHPDIAFEGGFVMAETWEIPPYVGRPLTLYLIPEMVLD